MKQNLFNDFLKGRLKSIYYAFRGVVLLIRTEASIQVQCFLSILVIIAGFYFNISSIEWMFQTLAIGLVLGIESLNTAIESLADFIQPNYDSKIGFIKDVAAGSVTFVALAAITITLIIYLPKIYYF